MAPPKGFIPWNKGLKGIHLSPNTEIKKGQHLSPKTEFKKGHRPKRPIKRGQRISPKTEFKKGDMAWNKGKPHLKNENHPMWRGDDVGYSGLHTWIHRNLGRAKKCEYKNCKYPRKNKANKIIYKPKIYNWANISREYKRDVSDWIQLCPSCHAKYDRNLIKL